MSNLDYLVPRVIRHFLPDSVVRFLLTRGWIIRPGLETSRPLEAVERYQKTLAQNGISLEGKRILLFGYGGNYSVGCNLLKLGAQHVVLTEREGFPDNRANRALYPEFKEYLELKDDVAVPHLDCMTVIHQDIHETAAQKQVEPVDIVLSTSVYEHLDGVESITQALASLTKKDGAHLHFVDLRDHYFKYSFEMLCYTEKTWRRWLNPTSHHNRFRYRDYERVFASLFEEVKIKVEGRDMESFQKARARILPQYITGDDSIDSVTGIQVLAIHPKS